MIKAAVTKESLYRMNTLMEAFQGFLGLELGEFTFKVKPGVFLLTDVKSYLIGDKYDDAFNALVDFVLRNDRDAVEGTETDVTIRLGLSPSDMVVKRQDKTFTFTHGELEFEVHWINL
ncbi:hypothetical protein [Bacillus phage SPO1L3]|nr:hypothetical protein Goe9_c00180 [Bacillus phage vB_BsuM-Goe9]QMV48521.1 hypothetical protein Goe9_c02180 [Bacillus phage vB_BsuM-Goe9]QMV48550.1 hypothetical protein Goe10_c00190 [Bacillus phage vB_BsuM-Goe10]QMV48745.1 hypothetical protein Goe10_c02170 [Bacillus phage vB_BsuM-Goe10]WIT26352.1 hypothetical protein [Bacillus phage SPO1L3]